MHSRLACAAQAFSRIGAFRAVAASSSVPTIGRRGLLSGSKFFYQERDAKQSVTNGQQPSEPVAEAAPSEETAKSVTILVHELEALKENVNKLADLQDKLLRAMADAENTRRRAQIDVENTRKYGIQNFAKELLGVADYLSMALAHVPKAALEEGRDPLLKNLFDGVAATEAEMLRTFSKFGLQKYDPLGQKFDPNIHEALFQVDDPSREPGTVAVVDKAGFQLHDRVIRPAKVGVVKKRPIEQPPEQ